MLTYLVDDRGRNGEYAYFLEAHAERLPALELEVMAHWSALAPRLAQRAPDLVLLDMQFDEGEVAQLCGDLDALAGSARFAGDLRRAETQLRRFQGVFLAQTLRRHDFTGPIVLFGSLPGPQADRLVESHGPLRIVEGLLYEPVREALAWARTHVDAARLRRQRGAEALVGNGAEALVGNGAAASRIHESER